jgi:hypothetical protein
MRSIPHQANHANFGLMFFEPGWQPGAPFDYLACVEVTQIDSIPMNTLQQNYLEDEKWQNISTVH